MGLQIAVVVALLGCLSVGFADDPIVRTTTGILHGKRTTTLQKPLALFLGVPYAKPPVDALRFAPPQELHSETDVVNAANYAASCYQPPHLKTVISPLLKPNQAQISEDCLYLNVFVPEVHDQSLGRLPVMVWLPGEGYDYADPQQFDGSYLAVLGKVIVVTVNYRLSAFGFLSTLTTDAPGNVGLLDQRMALRWLKKNVAKFGGDPDNVTLFGRLTGSMSAAIQAFSPKNKEEKLFHRIILQSGIPVGDWVFERDPLNATFTLAHSTNCASSSVAKTLDCLRKLPADVVLEKALAYPPRFRPVFDGQLIAEETLNAAERSTIEPIDVLLGINNDEGSLCATTLNAMQSPYYKKLLERELSISDFHDLVDSNMLTIYKKRDYLLNKLAVHEYSGDDEKQSNLGQSFINFCGDMLITSHVQKLADIMANQNKGQVYMYEFAHRPTFSIQPPFIKAGHGDDVLFTLGLPFQLSDLPEEEAKLTRKMVKAVVNFARKGNPNHDGSTGVNWPQYTTENREIMTFVTSRKEEEEEVVRKSSHDGAVAFWHDVVPAMQHRSCPVSRGHPYFPVSESTIAQGHPTLQVQSLTEGPFLGGVLSLQEAEYLLMGLFCMAVFLFITSTLALLLLWRNKKYETFQRFK